MSLSNILKAAKSGEKCLIQVNAPVIPTEHFHTTDPEALAKQIIDDANNRAADIQQKLEAERQAFQTMIENEKEAWLQEREKERQTYQELGYKEGFDKGTNEAETKWINLLNEARDIVSASEREYKKYIDHAEQDILNLSVMIAGKIVTEVLHKEPETWMTLVKRAIKEVRDQDTIKIIVSTMRFQHVLDGKEEIQSISRDARIQIFPDDSLGDNDCFIETPFGRIEASVDRQLTVIKQTLKDMLEAGGDESQGTD